MRLVIVGHRLPGREFCSEGELLRNVHVGVQERSLAVGLVAGDAAVAQWDLLLRSVTSPDGTVDFFGPAVHGRRGERFVYLTWGDVSGESFQMFRRAKLMLDAVPADLLADAAEDGRWLQADVELTDECGAPRCARVSAPALIWSAR